MFASAEEKLNSEKLCSTNLSPMKSSGVEPEVPWQKPSLELLKLCNSLN
jgi:hypothetical protein